MVGEVYLEWEERKSDGSPNISILILSLCFSSSYPQLSELFVYIFFSILSSKWLAGRRSINPNMVVYIGAALRCKKLHCIAIWRTWIIGSTSAQNHRCRCIYDCRKMKRTVMHIYAPLRRNAYICTARWSLVSALQSSVFNWTCILGTVWWNSIFWQCVFGTVFLEQWALLFAVCS